MIYQLMCSVLAVIALAGCVTLHDRTEKINDAIVESMGTTCTAWQGIDQAMADVIAFKDAATPYLSVFVRMEHDCHGSDYEYEDAYRRARALYLLARIGTPEAECTLVSVLGPVEKPDWRVVCSLAILNREDVIHGLIDRAWYDCKHEGDIPRYRVWWTKHGKSKYTKQSNQSMHGTACRRP